MSQLLDWLKDNVRTAVGKCGAAGASIYVPTPWNEAAPGVLVHVGQCAPLPEMADLGHALEFAARASASLWLENQPAGQGAIIASAVPEGCIVPIPMLAAHWRGSSAAADDAADDDAAANDHLRRLSDQRAAPPIVGWLGLRFHDRPARPDFSGGWPSVLEIASALASTYVCFYGILTDPVTGLPGRAELNGTLRAELERVQSTALPFSLLFLKLEELDCINERLGRRGGDAALREFLDIVQDAIRTSDVVMRYGGPVFALPLRDVNAAGATIVGEKIRRRLAEHRFLDGTTVLACAVGAVSCNPAEVASLHPIDLLRRADQALSASRRDRGGQVVLWRADSEIATRELLDPLLGVFTGDAEKDYRNMRLLWDVLQALSSSTGAELAQGAVGPLLSLFAATRAALFQPDNDGRLQLVAGRLRTVGSTDATHWSSDQVSIEEWRLNQQALDSGVPQCTSLSTADEGEAPSALNAFAVPLVIDGRAIGSLYLQSRLDVLKIDRTDLPVLCGVANHLALALDRDRLTAQQRSREQREQALLKGELDRLRTAVQQAKFMFLSAPMTQLLDITRRVATTDATVLITGESGTGKEMLAHTIHTLSNRHRKPLVIVDCGAIPASLIDSELFGRERGAYTGAERRATGRLAQADGGTVFLDEIGELPLEVQAKLLRFVQEKTITMVGATQAQRVDVRIVAATNRGLEDEVREGRFREDLFHRLNVVRLRIPPLRDRTGDVPLLARHFLDTFAVQYGKAIRCFDADAERALLAYSWPGNVRELQNTILQAVLLTEGEHVSADDLQLPEATTDRSRRGEGPSLAGAVPVVVGSDTAPARRPVDATFDSAWRVLSVCLGAEVAAAGDGGGSLPLGRWLSNGVVLEAYEWADHVMSRGAQRVGLPETTFSRRLRKAHAEAASTRQPDTWAAIQAALSNVLRAAEDVPDLAEQVDSLLFAMVVSPPRPTGQAAALLGISLPTLKRRLTEFEHARPT